MRVKRQTKPKTKILKKRPPVVVLLGHVDHGKTTLLSALKKNDLTKKEHGGISQHTSVYQVLTPSGPSITFIDTPGHQAFAKMRSRGAEVADLALLVVAANEGMKPQTRESLAYIRAAKLPFFVVINKIDLTGANQEMVKSQLAKEGILVEDRSGKIVCLEVSAKTKKGLEELMEMILLFAELEEIKAEVAGDWKAVVIESSLDSKKGSLATLLVKKGILRVGQEIFSEKGKARVRAIFDEEGKRVIKLGPGQAGIILGFDRPLAVGSLVAERRPKKERRLEKLKVADQETPTKETGGKGIKVILKADTRGTLQAIEESLPAKVTIVSKGVGRVNESDVLQATTAEAKILAFNIGPSKSAQKLAKTEKVAIVSFQVIYELLDWLEERLKVKKKVKKEERIKGRAKVIAQFQAGALKIAGCKILEGELRLNDKVRLERMDKVIGQTTISSLKHKKEVVKKAIEGREYGLSFEPSLDFSRGDMVISYSEK